MFALFKPSSSQKLAPTNILNYSKLDEHKAKAITLINSMLENMIIINSGPKNFYQFFFKLINLIAYNLGISLTDTKSTTEQQAHIFINIINYYLTNISSEDKYKITTNIEKVKISRNINEFFCENIIKPTTDTNAYATFSIQVDFDLVGKTLAFVLHEVFYIILPNAINSNWEAMYGNSNNIINKNKPDYESYLKAYQLEFSQLILPLIQAENRSASFGSIRMKPAAPDESNGVELSIHPILKPSWLNRISTLFSSSNTRSTNNNHKQTNKINKTDIIDRLDNQMRL